MSLITQNIFITILAKYLLKVGPPRTSSLSRPYVSSNCPVLKELKDLWVPICSGLTAISYVKGLDLSKVTYKE